ncbi:type II toxin-antitoxin system HigA family antitoxin [Francisella philomiragia]|uniref:helix-turn-helix domain-containing protein n=1 Tax=Francisella philomiragia TaxID=28110 RepID=UPI0019052DD5|nr:hypothetical protein [Francisella philomiragia]MBK2025367.1 transcriptional regulator [Francisella philomiragia]
MKKPAFNYTNKDGKKIHITMDYFKKPSNDQEYEKLEILLDSLIDEVRDDEKHPLATAMQIIGDNLEAYDNEMNLPIGHGLSAIEIVKQAMEINHLTQDDLSPIFGSQGNVSSFLNGKRDLSLKVIRKLKEKFNIDPSLLII